MKRHAHFCPIHGDIYGCSCYAYRSVSTIVLECKGCLDKLEKKEDTQDEDSDATIREDLRRAVPTPETVGEIHLKALRLSFGMATTLRESSRKKKGGHANENTK